MGLILPGNKILELRNESEHPAFTFRVARDEIDKHPDAWAMWHTHTGTHVNLSPEDYRAFLQVPWLVQFIIAEDRVRRFSVHGGKVYLDEASCL